MQPIPFSLGQSIAVHARCNNPRLKALPLPDTVGLNRRSIGPLRDNTAYDQVQAVKQRSAEDKIRIILEGLGAEESIAALCRREAIAESHYYAWSKEFLEAGKRRLAGDTARAALATTARRGRPRRNS